MKVAGRILATMIAMVAILLIAVGADKGLNYLEKRKYEKDVKSCMQKIMQKQNSCEHRLKNFRRTKQQ